SIAQDLAKAIFESSWLYQLDDIILGHGISLLRWRSGGVEHPHDMPPSRFTPSPTPGDSSKAADRRHSSGSAARSAPPAAATALPAPSPPETPRVASACACHRTRRQKNSAASPLDAPLMHPSLSSQPDP